MKKISVLHYHIGQIFSRMITDKETWCYYQEQSKKAKRPPEEIIAAVSINFAKALMDKCKKEGIR